MSWRRSDNRAFNYAVIFSLALHGALLFAFTMKPSKAPPSAPGPIVARLAPARPAAPPAAQPQPEPPKRVEEPAPPPPPPETRPVHPKPSPLAKAEPRPSKPAPAAKAEPASPTPAQAAPAQSAPAAPAAAAPTPAPTAKVEAAPATTPSPDSGTLDMYRMELMRMARNYKKYPRVAMDNNWEGKVVIRMVIGANGMISTIAVLNSAGHEILDKQALEMIQRAKTRVQIPAALRGREFVLEIPVIYSLKEPDAG
jgi:protein TonB